MGCGCSQAALTLGKHPDSACGTAVMWSRFRAKFSTQAEKEDKFKKWGFCGSGKPG